MATSDIKKPEVQKAMKEAREAYRRGQLTAEMVRKLNQALNKNSRNWYSTGFLL